MDEWQRSRTVLISGLLLWTLCLFFVVVLPEQPLYRHVDNGPVSSGDQTIVSTSVNEREQIH